MSADTKLIVNLTRGTALCRSENVDPLLGRLRGLTGGGELAAGQGILVRAAPPVHTAFGRAPVDALLLDDDLRVMDVRAGVRPWRVVARRRARAVLALAAGESHRLGVRAGDQLSVREGGPVAAVPPLVADPDGPIPIRARRTAAAPAALRVHGAAVDSARGPAPIALVAPLPLAAETGDDGVAPASPLSVLVISGDRRFRSVTTVLIARRGCAVATAEHTGRLAELAERVDPDVVVIDLADGGTASAGALDQARSLKRRVGIVLVDEEETVGAGDAGISHVHGKWGEFPALFAAIEAAGRSRPAAEVDHEVA